ncbi:MAG TPA: response regulator, partial [Leptospiraceae bacterium]|nr:response regulator [Leptospiraceae bacterium]
MRALILENSKLVRNMIRAIFESDKFEVFEAGTSSEANQNYAQETFDVITLSLYLEGEDGF